MIIDSPQLKDSIEFYNKIGFTITKVDAYNFATDGKVIIRLNPDHTARLGIIHSTTDPIAFADKLKSHVSVTKEGENIALTTPAGARLTLTATPLPDLKKLNAPAGIIGNFAGISLESTDFEKSVKVWKAMDFNITMGALEQGWLVMVDPGGSALSIMKSGSCPHLFFNPSLSYFNGEKNLGIIEDIRNSGIPITQEITAFNNKGIADNIIIRDPAGLGFFIFSD